MDPIRFSATIRYWDPAKSSGLAVVDIPKDHVPALGGLKQQQAPRLHLRRGVRLKCHAGG